MKGKYIGTNVTITHRFYKTDYELKTGAIGTIIPGETNEFVAFHADEWTHHEYVILKRELVVDAEEI